MYRGSSGYHDSRLGTKGDGVDQRVHTWQHSFEQGWPAVLAAYPSCLGLLELVVHVAHVFPLHAGWVSDSWWWREVGPMRMYKIFKKKLI